MDSFTDIFVQRVEATGDKEAEEGKDKKKGKKAGKKKKKTSRGNLPSDRSNILLDRERGRPEN